MTIQKNVRFFPKDRVESDLPVKNFCDRTLLFASFINSLNGFSRKAQILLQST